MYAYLFRIEFINIFIECVIDIYIYYFESEKNILEVCEIFKYFIC